MFTVLEPNQVKEIAEQPRLYLKVQRCICAQTGREIDLKQPRFELLVDQDIESEQLKAVIILLVGVYLGGTSCVAIRVWQHHFNAVPQKRFS